MTSDDNDHNAGVNGKAPADEALKMSYLLFQTLLKEANDKELAKFMVLELFNTVIVDTGADNSHGTSSDTSGLQGSNEGVTRPTNTRSTHRDTTSFAKSNTNEASKSGRDTNRPIDQAETPTNPRNTNHASMLPSDLQRRRHPGVQCDHSSDFGKIPRSRESKCMALDCEQTVGGGAKCPDCQLILCRHCDEKLLSERESNMRSRKRKK